MCWLRAAKGEALWWAWVLAWPARLSKAAAAGWEGRLKLGAGPWISSAWLEEQFRAMGGEGEGPGFFCVPSRKEVSLWNRDGGRSCVLLVGGRF